MGGKGVLVGGCWFHVPLSGKDILNRKHPALMFCFILAFLPMGIIISILREVVFGWMERPFIPLAIIFIALLAGLEYIILKRVKM